MTEEINAAITFTQTLLLTQNERLLNICFDFKVIERLIKSIKTFPIVCLKTIIKP